PSTDNHEIEAKFAFSDATLAEQWRTRPALSSGFNLEPATTVVHTDTYLDSPSYDLLRKGYTLRLRHTDDGYVVTVKSLNTAGEALVHTRLELEGPLKQGSPPLAISGWPKQIRKLVTGLMGAKTDWQPLCTLRQIRHKRAILAKGQPVAELSIDEVTVYAAEVYATATNPLKPSDPTPSGDQPGLTTFWEIEVELLAAQDSAILERLAQLVQRTRGLSPNLTSKLERALESISVYAHNEGMDVRFMQPTMPMAEACRLIWHQQFVQLLLKEAGVRYSHDSEFVHDMRVAVRRARVAARLFGDYFQAKAVRAFIKNLKQTGRALGAVRDLDVALEKLAKYQKKQGQAEQGVEEDHVAPLAAQWRNDRKAAHQALLAWLDSPDYNQFVKRFACFCQTAGEGAKKFAFAPNETPTPYQVRHVIPSLLVNRFERVRSFETLFDAGDVIPPTTLHLLRIECKYMRYSLEFTRHLLGLPGEQLIEALKGLQEHLGDLNDAAVSREMLTAKQIRLDKTTLDRYVRAQSELIEGVRTELEQDLQHFLSLPSRRKLAQAIVRI
ncbi:MAG: CHAD domain-containing protein, partial [Chloroflexota bacterium]|nr:CHAD domain-containing protein [Chloroflexota bacterium]